MARLSPLHDAVPRVGGFLNVGLRAWSRGWVETRNISTGIGYLLCDRLIDWHGSERREAPL